MVAAPSGGFHQAKTQARTVLIPCVTLCMKRCTVPRGRYWAVLIMFLFMRQLSDRIDMMQTPYMRHSNKKCSPFTYLPRIPLPLVVVVHRHMPGHNHRDRGRILLCTRHEPGHQTYRDCSALAFAVNERNNPTYPYCRPSSNPGSRSVRMILSSSLVPPMYFRQSKAS